MIFKKLKKTFLSTGKYYDLKLITTPKEYKHESSKEYKYYSKSMFKIIHLYIPVL